MVSGVRSFTLQDQFIRQHLLPHQLEGKLHIFDGLRSPEEQLAGAIDHDLLEGMFQTEDDCCHVFGLDGTAVLAKLAQVDLEVYV